MSETTSDPKPSVVARLISQEAENGELSTLITLGLYTKAKAEWEEEYFKSRGFAPDANEILRFESFWTQSTIDNVRLSSKTVLDNFYKNISMNKFKLYERNEIKSRNLMEKIFPLVIVIIFALVFIFNICFFQRGKYQ